MTENGDITRGSRAVKQAELRVKRLCNGAERLVRNDNIFLHPGMGSEGRPWMSRCKGGGKTLRRSTSLVTITGKGSAVRDCCVNKTKINGEKKSNSSKQEQLKWRVLYSFSRNLSRKRKLEVDSQSVQLDQINETIAKLNIQISLLKSIIRSDETIRDSWKKRLQDIKKILGPALEENIKLKNEMGVVSGNVEKMKDRLAHMETENNNYKNTQILLKSECSAFELQLKKERESNSLLRYESELEIKKLNKKLEEKVTENDNLATEVEGLQWELEEKSVNLSECEEKLLNTTRLWQNSVKEIKQLNKETFDLDRANQQLKDEMLSLKQSVSLLEGNQEQIYKYFNLNID